MGDWKNELPFDFFPEDIPNPFDHHLNEKQLEKLYSHYVARLDQCLPKSHKKLDIDLYLTAGGFKGYYYCGPIYYFLHGMRYNVINAHGASAGAAAAAAIFCKINIARYTYFYHSKFKNSNGQNKTIVECFTDIFRDLFPKNAFELCNNRLHISVQEVTSNVTKSCKNVIIKQFQNQEYFMNNLLSSMSIPGFTINGSSFEFDGKQFLDGITPDYSQIHQNKRPQLNINLQRVSYPSYMKLSPSDQNICILVIKGMWDFEKFIRNESPVPPTGITNIHNFMNRKIVDSLKRRKCEHDKSNKRGGYYSSDDDDDDDDRKERKKEQKCDHEDDNGDRKLIWTDSMLQNFGLNNTSEHNHNLPIYWIHFHDYHDSKIFKNHVMRTNLQKYALRLCSITSEIKNQFISHHRKIKKAGSIVTELH